MAAPRRDFEEVVVEPVQLGRYFLLDTIAHGRTGTVYRACLKREARPDALLAVKRISGELSGDRRFAERFVAATSRAAQLEHPAHCAIEDVGRAPDGSLFVATELVAGKDLGRVAIELQERGEIVPPQLVAFIGIQLADALSAAHRMTRAGEPSPLYHGEISPSDILVAYDGRVLLTGLGMAELPSTTPRSAYRAPELALGAQCSARSDVFSLGACLYELLTGAPAVAGDTRDTAEGGTRKESAVTQVVARPLEQVLQRALCEPPEQRWQSADELGGALRAFSAAQQNPMTGRSLAVFMIALFDAEIAAEERQLRALLARVPAAAPRVSGAAGPTQAADVRHSHARLVRGARGAQETARSAKAARPAASAPDAVGGWTDPSEDTPVQGLLMRKLARDMVPESALPRAAAVEPARVAPPPPPSLAPALKLQDLAAASWDDDSPTIWIGPGERTRVAPPPVPPLRSMPIPSLPRPPRLPTAALQQAPPLPSSRPAPAASPAPGPIAQRPRWLRAMIAGSAIGLLLAGFLLLLGRGGGRELGSLEARTQPAGAAANPDVAVVRRAELPSNAAAPLQGATRPQAAAAAQPEIEPTAGPATDRAARKRRRSGERRETLGGRAEEIASAADQPAASSTAAADAPDAAGSKAVLPAAPGAVAPSSIARAASAEPAPKPAVASSAAPKPRGESRDALALTREPPRFPARAKRTGIAEGVVTVEFTIDPSGAVRNPSVVASQPADVFDESALRAIEKWRFRPKLDNGAPVTSRQRFTFRFRE